MRLPLRRRMLLRAAPSGAAMVALGIAGCASGPPPPAVLDLAVTGGADQNPDEQGRASPVALRLYQLSSAGRFEQADVFALLEHEAATLGNDLLESESFVLVPSEKKRIQHELKPGTRYLGVTALFRTIDAAQWRADAAAQASGPVRLALTVAALSVTLGPANT